MRPSSLWLAISAAFFMMEPRAWAEQPDALKIGDLQIGFAGVYKVGHWTPLAVTLRSSQDDAVSGDLVVQLDDGDGIATMVRERGVTLAAGQESIVRALAKPGRPQGAIEVTFESDKGAAARTFAQDDIPLALLATEELLVEIGGPIGLEELQRHYPENSLERPTATSVKDLNSLPRRSLGFDGVDLVVVTTGDTVLNQAWSNHEETIHALDEWVRLGGKLILCVGREGERVLAAGSPLARFAPGVFERIAERDPGPWESFAGAATEPMETPEGRTRSIATTVIGEVQGRVELSDGNIDLVIRAPYGFGEVVFVAADLERPPFADWSARTKLLLRLLGRSELLVTQTAADETNTQSIRLGYTGLAGQLRAAVGQFAGARVVPFWLVFFLALCYAAAVFPLEYTIARWLRPRFEAAWVLLPLVLAAGAGGIWYLAVEWKGEDILLNKVEVADVDLASGTVRGHAWLGLYSPRTDAYDVGVAATGRGLKSIEAPQVSWLGLPGTGLGGMNSQMVAAEQFERGYTFGEQGAVQDVPLAAWSSKAFEASWQASVKESPAQLGERTADRQPLGVLRNNIGVTLRDCVLFYEGWSYQLGTIERGDSVDVGRNQRVLTIKSYLTGRRRSGDKDQATPYAPEGTELPQIVRAILFHDSAGGRQYTSLSNRVYHRLDLTGQLRLGRAVLTAMGPPVSRVAVSAVRGSEPQMEEELTFYRFVIPVDRSSSSDDGQQTVELRLD
ncbi:MAG: hypothetical protein WD894_05870 [Pirellulales bacterium]